MTRWEALHVIRHPRDKDGNVVLTATLGGDDALRRSGWTKDRISQIFADAKARDAARQGPARRQRPPED